MKNNKPRRRWKIAIITLHYLPNQILTEKTILNKWNESIIIISHKKGDGPDLKNYRRITLDDVIFKLLRRMLTHRFTTIFALKNKLAKSFSTCDHLITEKTFTERANEYYSLVYIAFIDCEKAFDYAEH